MPSSICKSLQTAWTNLQPANSREYLKTQIKALAFVATTALVSPAAAAGFAALAVVYNASGCFFPKNPKKGTADIWNPTPAQSHSENPVFDCDKPKPPKTERAAGFILKTQKEWEKQVGDHYDKLDELMPLALQGDPQAISELHAMNVFDFKKYL